MINGLTDFLKKHVKAGGDLYIVNELDDGQVILSTTKEPDRRSCAFVDMAFIVDELRISTDVAAGMPEPFRTHLKNGGKLYSIGGPQNGEICVSMSNDGTGEMFMEEYRKASDDITGNYAQMGAVMTKCIHDLKDDESSGNARQAAAAELRNHLIYCAQLKELDDLTVIYRDKTEDNSIGYDPAAVSQFVNALCEKYLGLEP